MQAQLNIDQGIIQRVVAQRAPSVLPRAAAISGNASAWGAAIDTDCRGVLPSCPASDLNPFPNGVNVTMAYGQYIDVEPEALQSYYSNTFLLAMTTCVEDEASCAKAVPAGTQVRRARPCSLPAAPAWCCSCRACAMGVQHGP